MGSKANLETAVARIGERLGCDLGLDSSGCCSLQLTSDVVVAVARPTNSPFVLFHAVVCDLSKVDRALCMNVAMRRNFFAVGAPNVWLALQPDSDDLLVCSAAEENTIEEYSLSEAILRIWEETQRTRVAISAEIARSADASTKGDELDVAVS